MEKDRKPDLSGRVNGFDISIFQRGSGIEISVGDTEGREVVLFRYNPQPLTQQETPQRTALAAAAPVEPVNAAPSEAVLGAETKPTPTLVKISGIIDAIEGMGKTPGRGDPVFRMSVKVVNPQTHVEEVKEIAAFREIAHRLDQLHTSDDPNSKLETGRAISMMAWHHVESQSFYPSQVNYLNLPPIVNPKGQKRR